MKLIENQCFDEERALYGSNGIKIKNCRFDGAADGESALKESQDVVVEGCYWNLRYPFWHAKNVTVKNSVIKGEYLAWYAEDITFENCVITGTQPFCYCKGLKLINCEMHEADLCFEKSEVEATIMTPVISIKNPKAGCIKVPAVNEIIQDDPDAKGEIVCS